MAGFEVIIYGRFWVIAEGPSTFWGALDQAISRKHCRLHHTTARRHSLVLPRIVSHRLMKISGPDSYPTAPSLGRSRELFFQCLPKSFSGSTGSSLQMNELAPMLFPS